MQIQLCEDDGDFHDAGIPQLVVLVVKFDNGKTKRIPYPAEKTIASLYQDLKSIAPQYEYKPSEDLVFHEVATPINLEPAVVAPKEPTKDKVPSEQRATRAPAEDLSNVICKEDIITLIKLNPREFQSGTVSPLIVGMDYRVLKVIGPTIPTPDGKGIKKIIQGFDVIDDTAPTPERMVVTPDEVQLKSKRLSQVIKKTQAVEEMLPCPDCRTLNALTLVGTDFKGTCEACGVDIDIGRVIKKCPSVGCGQEVSCFDVGGKYEGLCGKCKAKIEVAYA